MASSALRQSALNPARNWSRALWSAAKPAPFPPFLRVPTPQPCAGCPCEPNRAPSTRRSFFVLSAARGKQDRSSQKGKKGATEGRNNRSDKSSAPDKKSTSDRSSSGSEDAGDAKHPTASPSAPLDLADVTSRLSHLDQHYKEALKKLQAGGRFNPTTIGALLVQPDKASRETFPLRELAEIVPRGGRTVSLLVHDKAYVKPIISAVQNSAEFNQQPQRDPDNELELTLKVEAERRDEQAKRVKTLTQEWRDRVRQVRSRREKQTAGWVKEKLVLVDTKPQVGKALGKLQDDVFKEIDRLEKQMLAQLEPERS